MTANFTKFIFEAVVYQKIRREEAAKRLKPEACHHTAGASFGSIHVSFQDQRNVYVERSDIWVKKMARKAG